jgi:hypothetical protein
MLLTRFFSQKLPPALKSSPADKKQNPRVETDVKQRACRQSKLSLGLTPSPPR